MEKAFELFKAGKIEEMSKKQLEFLLENKDYDDFNFEEKQIEFEEKQIEQMEARLNEINEKEKQIMFNKSKKSWNDIINILEMSKDYDDEEDLLLNLYDPNESLPDIESSLHLKLNLPPNSNDPNGQSLSSNQNEPVKIFEDFQMQLNPIYYFSGIHSRNFLRFSIQQQEKYHNDVINDGKKFKEEHPELNSCDDSKRFIFTNIGQNYPIFLKNLLAINAIRVCPNNFIYYNVIKNRFYNRDECFAAIKEKIDFINYASKFFDAFSDCFKAELLWNLLNANGIAKENVDTQIEMLQKQKKQTISSELRLKMIEEMIHQIHTEIPKKIEKDTGIKFTLVKIKNILTFTDERTKRISIYINTSNANLRIKIHGDKGERNFLSKISLLDYLCSHPEDRQAKSNRILAMLAQFKKDFVKHILAVENYAVVPLIFFNPNFTSTIYVIEDSASAETANIITCNLIFALLAKSWPNSFKYIANVKEFDLSINTGISKNYNMCDVLWHPYDLRVRFDFKDFFSDLHKFYEQIDVFNKGYIEEGIKNGKKIYRVYSSFIFTKDHIPKLFLLISMLSNIDKVLAESKEGLRESSIAYLKKWPDIFKKLPEEIQRKYINFATKSGFDNSKIYSIDPIQFYEILTKDYGFTNIEFFRLNFALEHLEKFFNSPYSTGPVFKQINDYFKWALNDFNTSKIPDDKNKLFDDVIQYSPSRLINYYDICIFNHRNKDIDFAILDVNTNEMKTISKAIDRTIYDDFNPNRIAANETKIFVAEVPPQNLIENPAPIPQLGPTPIYHSHNTI